ncbi:hypothetical protein CGC21_0055 [Leishmania donovani]|uniref:Pre-mRNA-splicing factor SLU7 n=1 Tax=Leishmania donovani TaxID=5661 RepID=A0A504XNV6_LEIDO|nr:hypothetical protein CGC21_0055 [Leishmania donovani]
MEPNADEPKKSSVRQLLRQQRELQEMRKFGLAPLAVDTETHQEISPNIPEFISRAPWYYGATGPTLVHQRKQGDSATGVSDEVLDEKVDRIVVKGQASCFTAGACKNCGSRTHKTSECFQAKKKVGSVYTNRVTGSDIETHQEAKTYSQKRDRFVGEVGIDLMRAVRQGQEDDSVDYLHNLDQQDGLFFDPKTGSMRANPNAGDSTKAFRGDLERYRTGDYYNYVESQYRFLTGQSRSFVDFDQPKFDSDVPPSSTTESKTSAPSSSPAPPIDALVTTATATVAAHSSVQAASLSWVTTRNGHAAVYGSYFDPIHFRWGYACCKRMGKDAAGCSATHA